MLSSAFAAGKWMVRKNQACVRWAASQLPQPATAQPRAPKPSRSAAHLPLQAQVVGQGPVHLNPPLADGGDPAVFQRSKDG